MAEPVEIPFTTFVDQRSIGAQSATTCVVTRYRGRSNRLDVLACSFYRSAGDEEKRKYNRASFAFFKGSPDLLLSSALYDYGSS